MLRGGAGLRELQAFLRHRRITNTEVYTHVVKEDLKKVVGEFHPREQ
jgi:site-specific recombinase XerD